MKLRAGLVAGWLGGLILGLASHSAVPAEKQWLALRTPLFGVVSQLNERDTRRWAGEFGQFVEALGQLYTIEEAALPALTIVLFDRARAFAPYRPVTRSGQADRVDGLFGRRANWSVIGMSGARGSKRTLRTVQHEAVHWFTSAFVVRPPLWFAEGFAEAFSTFEVVDGQARWGAAIPEHVGYLNQRGLQPLEEFFRVSQDEALHDNQRFYPQAWAFVHYGMFGSRGAHREKLAEFLRLLRREPTDVAFQAAFGADFESIDRELQRYLRGGEYAIAVLDLPDRSAAYEIAVASPVQVQFALARLALVGGNLDLAERHALAVVEAVPGQSPGYEVLAQVHLQRGAREPGRHALARAMELGSQDAGLYLLDAQLTLEPLLASNSWIDQLMPAAQARTVADSVLRSLGLQPRNPPAFETLALALANVAELTEQDERALGLGEQLLPRTGLVALVRAVAANRSGDLDRARDLLREARSDARELPPAFRIATAQLDDRWVLDALADRFTAVAGLADLDRIDALLAEVAVAAERSQLMDKALRRFAIEARVYRLQFEALEALDSGDLDRARRLLRSIADDPEAPRGARNSAERTLASLDG